MSCITLPTVEPWESALPHLSDLKPGDPAPRAPELRTEADIVGAWTDGPPVVSVFCTAYQFADYIDDALRGILGQETPFPFEVFVRDDASTDGTDDIVADYASRYPSIVTAVLESENKWPNTRPWDTLRPMARGEFIALCDGDDYWIDPRKLQIQVASLLGNTSIVAAHHGLITIKGTFVKSSHRPSLETTGVSYSSTQMELGRSHLPTSTLLHRNVPLPKLKRPDRVVNGDNFLWACLGRYGDALFNTEIAPTIYREHPGGVWSLLHSDDRKIRHAESLYWIGLQLADEGRLDAARSHLAKSARRIAVSRGGPKYDVRLELGVVGGAKSAVIRGAPLLHRMFVRLRRIMRGLLVVTQGPKAWRDSGRPSRQDSTGATDVGSS